MRSPTPFEGQVYAALKRIPEGKVTTYGALARYVGVPYGARAVGRALNCNPYAPHVPCHRVVGSTGMLVGYAFGLEKKIHLLSSEGVIVCNGKVDLKIFGYMFTD